MDSLARGAELTERLGYPPGQAPPGGTGNHRNGDPEDGAGRARAGGGPHAAAAGAPTSWAPFPRPFADPPGLDPRDRAPENPPLGADSPPFEVFWAGSGAVL